MKEKLEEIMRAYGQEITVIRRESGEETPVLGFLQPLLKEREEPSVTATPLGAVSGQRWLYIGPVDPELEMGDRMRFGEMDLWVQEAVLVCFQKKALYCRAVLRKEKEAAK